MGEDRVELMPEARKVSAGILESRTRGDVKFIISHVADNVPLLHFHTVLPGRSPVQKAHFSSGIIKKIGLPHIHDLFG